MYSSTTAICCEEGCNQTFGITSDNAPGIAIIMCKRCYQKKMSAVKTAFHLSLESKLTEEYIPK